MLGRGLGWDVVGGLVVVLSNTDGGGSGYRYTSPAIIMPPSPPPSRLWQHSHWVMAVALECAPPSVGFPGAAAGKSAYLLSGTFDGHASLFRAEMGRTGQAPSNFVKVCRTGGVMGRLRLSSGMRGGMWCGAGGEGAARLYFATKWAHVAPSQSHRNLFPTNLCRPSPPRYTPSCRIRRRPPPHRNKTLPPPPRSPTASWPF
jgi:hypothetical protein